MKPLFYALAIPDSPWKNQPWVEICCGVSTTSFAGGAAGATEASPLTVTTVMAYRAMAEIDRMASGPVNRP